MKQGLFLFTLCLIFSAQSQAVSTSTLPRGIRSPSLLIGNVQGLGEYYTDNGDLFRRGDLNSLSFDSKSLIQMSPEGAQLVAALNQFGNSHLGDQIHFGTLRIKTIPVIEYRVPVFAYGITDRWSLGLGLPILKYKNDFSMIHEPGNLEFYRSQFSNLSPDLDRALNMNLASEADILIQSKGYQKLESRNQTIIADIQIGSLYRFGEPGQTQVILSQTLTLPTGPKYNPDDLMALNIFGRTSLDLGAAIQIPIKANWNLTPYTVITLPFSVTQTMRIPKNEQDSLPDSSQKESVSLEPGKALLLGGESEFTLNKSWSTKFALEFSTKDSDQIHGSTNSRYDLLENNTYQNAGRSRILIQWSSVKSFLDKEFAIPLIASLEYSDTLMGTNTERRQITELNTMLFF